MFPFAYYKTAPPVLFRKLDSLTGLPVPLLPNTPIHSFVAREWYCTTAPDLAVIHLYYE